MGEQSPDDLVGITEGARLVGVTAETLREWADGRKITTYRTAGGHRRFRRADLLALLHGSRTDATDERAGAA